MPLFERVQARLDGHPYTRARQLDFAFTGLITCGHCGGAVTAELKKQKYVYYHCVTRCRREAYVPEARMSALFADAVRRLKLPDDIREAFVASLRDNRREVEARITAAQARLERVSRLINAAYEDSSRVASTTLLQRQARRVGLPARGGDRGDPAAHPRDREEPRHRDSGL